MEIARVPTRITKNTKEQKHDKCMIHENLLNNRLL